MYRKKLGSDPMNTGQSSNRSDKDILPLINVEDKHEDVAGIINYIEKGDCSFKVEDGFSIECFFSMRNKENPDGTSVRFIYQNGNFSQGYIGTVFINTDGRICYRKTAKSPHAPYLHGLLTRFFLSLSMRKMPDVVFVPEIINLEDFCTL